jgi:hypothetical protein
MFFPVFLHVFRRPHKRDGGARVGCKMHVPKGPNIETSRTGGARVGHGAELL